MSELPMIMQLLKLLIMSPSEGTLFFYMVAVLKIIRSELARSTISQMPMSGSLLT